MMTSEDWSSVIDQAADLDTRMVQFIGGEPTLHRDLPRLVEHALRRGVEVEVFSNLVHVPSALWDVFARPGVRLATSYYADNVDQHEAITMGRGSYTRTKANIVEALRRSIPLRVGVIDVEDGQRVAEARHELARWLPVGNVRREALAEIITGPRMIETTASLAECFARRPGAGPCDPQCGPNWGPACLPQCWPTGSGPCGPKGGCQPNYD